MEMNNIMSTAVTSRAKARLKAVVLFVATLFMGLYAVAQSSGADAKQPLKILYIGGDQDVLGGPGPQRAADFKKFLEQYFVSVSMTKGIDFKPEMAKDIDVIVKDAAIPLVLPPTFRKPMVLIGSNGLHGIDRTWHAFQDRSLVRVPREDKLHTIKR